MIALAPLSPSPLAPRGDVRPRARGAGRGARGVTLIELLVTISIVAVMAGAVMVGFGAAQSARLKQSGVLVAGAVRIAYSHANAISRPVRLVFDFERSQIILEEATDNFLLVRNERAGGAAAATEAERAAEEEAKRILEGPKAPRAAFRPSKAFGFSTDGDNQGKELASGVHFLSVHTGHTEEPELAGRAYLYFWPGGQTERAVITLVGGSPPDEELEANSLSILVSPLTGKAEIRKGRVALPPLRSEEDASEREDSL